MVERCRHTFEHIDPFGNYGTKPVSCFRPIESPYRKCIWHRDTHRKIASELASARTDHPEHIPQATLDGCQINSQVDFQDCELSEASFRGANLHSCNFSQVSAIHTDFSGANLSDANFQNAKLFANFSGSDLSGADLRGAELTHCNFSGATLSDITLGDTKLEGCFDGAEVPQSVSSGQLRSISREDLLKW